MGADLGLFSLTEPQKESSSSSSTSSLQSHHQQQFSQNQHQQTSLTPTTSTTAWMWNPNQAQDQDDESWEVRAFAEDTGNIMGATWPPRSYTCTFCRREFRSAQALGGHMNVHRRDRARLHQTQPSLTSTPSTSNSTFIIPGQEIPSNGAGLCLLYQLPNPNGPFSPTTVNASPPPLFSISPYHPHNNLIGQALNFPVAPPSKSCSHYFPSETAESSASIGNVNNNNSCNEFASEELDLELRLGHRSSTTPSYSG